MSDEQRQSFLDLLNVEVVKPDGIKDIKLWICRFHVRLLDYYKWE
jgi:hypothetical protein